jgi:D-glycerate 3-kinase
MMVQSLLLKGLANPDLQPEEWRSLCVDCLADEQRAAAFSLTADTVEAHLQQRLELLQVAYPAFATLRDRLFPPSNPPDDKLEPLWNLWLPLALQLVERRQAQTAPFVQGILGGQGTGKTTLGSILILLLAHLGYRTLSWSLDDLYKTYADRRQLQQQDPRLIWRGPPGTHDVELGIEVLDQLRWGTSEQIEIPRFDKSLHNGNGDRTSPERVTNIDIVLFEGWFVGVRPIHPALFDQAPPPIITESDRAFARNINTHLQKYLPLWEKLDSLWVLHIDDYQLSKQWRKQAEHAMKAAGKPGMSDAEIDAFVDYFWRSLHPELFIPPTLHHANLVIEIQPDHSLGTVSRPIG